MNRRYLRILLIVVPISVIVGFAILGNTNQAAPQYQGKPLTHWLSSFAAEYASLGASSNFDYAIRQSGTKAIPVLLRMLRENHPVADEIGSLLKYQQIVKVRHVRTHFRNDLGAHGFEILGAKA